MIYVVEQDRERIDQIAGKLYGTAHGGTVEALLAPNPGLADGGLPAAWPSYPRSPEAREAARRRAHAPVGVRGSPWPRPFRLTS